MTLDDFWLRIEVAINKYDNYGSCKICPVYKYAKEINTELTCGDCADELMMLHKKLEREEREKQEMLDELPW